MRLSIEARIAKLFFGLARVPVFILFAFQGHLLPGTGFMGVATPADTRKDERTYIHGSAVDVQAYYKTLEVSIELLYLAAVDRH